MEIPLLGSYICWTYSHSSLSLFFFTVTKFGTMAPPPKNNVRTISQEAFNALIQENIDDLDMDPTEALQDAIETFTLQGVDLSGIVTCVPGEENPVIGCLDRLREFSCENGVEEMKEVLERLYKLCFEEKEGDRNVKVAARNGGLELVMKVCEKFEEGWNDVLCVGLKVMALLIYDIQSTETFRTCGGPKIIVNILTISCQNINVWSSGFAVVAAAATGNELVKEAFVELKIDELLINILKGIGKDGIQSPYDAICVLLTPDDGRVVASQVYGYARRFGKIGMADVLMAPLRDGLTSPNLVSASIALKSVAVNDEICKSIAENGGIDDILHCIDDSGEQKNSTAAKACCSLLSKLAGSDTNKSSIVQKGGMDRLVKLSLQFAEDPSVILEVMSVICILSLWGGGQISMSEAVGDSGQVEDIVRPVINGGFSSRTRVLPRDAAKRGMSEAVGDSGAVKKLGENGVRSVGNASSGSGILSTAVKASSEIVNDLWVVKKEVGISTRSLGSGVGMLNLSKVGSSEKVFEHQSKKSKGSGNGGAAAGVAVVVPKSTGNHFRPVVLPVNNASKGNNNVAAAAASRVVALPKQVESKIRPVMLPSVNVGKGTGDAVSPVVALKKIGNIVRSLGNSTSGCTVLPSTNAVKGSGAVATATATVAVPKQVVNIRPVVNPTSGSSVLPSTNVGKGSGTVAASAVAPKLVESSVRSVSYTPKSSSGSGGNVDKSNASSVTGRQQLQDSAKLMEEKKTSSLPPSDEEKNGLSSVAFSLRKTSSKDETVASTLKVKDEKPIT